MVGAEDYPVMLRAEGIITNQRMTLWLEKELVELTNLHRYQ